MVLFVAVPLLGPALGLSDHPQQKFSLSLFAAGARGLKLALILGNV